ncbi:MAG TPA: hypothetical protein VJA19_22215, partial [Pseudomonas sp.]|nr:hypothetical protein [Pseudomonas sp.]
MEFKLGATLWSRPAENRSPAQTQETASDFEKKLGLPARRSESSADRQSLAQRQTQEGSLEWQAAQLLLNPRKTAQTGSPAELYAWGSLAGHHLSHMPGFFQDSPGSEAPLVAAVAVAAPQTAASLPGLIQAPAGIQAGPSATGSPLALGEQPAGVEQGRGAQGPTAALGRFF